MFTTLSRHPLRQALAAMRQLLARQMPRRQQHPLDALQRHEAVLEFHHEAGAPEGALYVDGRLVGYLPGLTRL